MRKTAVLAALWAVTFLITSVIMSFFMNRGNTDMTIEMSEATLPLVYAQRGEMLINTMHGYLREIDEDTMRETITPLEEGRKVSFVIEKSGCPVKGVSFELRSADGKRLVEATKLDSYYENGDIIRADITLKDLIEACREYCLVLLIEDEDGRVIRYYTRVILAPEYPADEELMFVMDFHERLYDKAAARSLTPYLESNAQGDNSTYAHVDIHSSFQQITWGDLKVTEEITPIPSIKEFGENISNIRLDYVVSTGSGNLKALYNVSEIFRMRYTSERILLLNYERTMDQIFQSKSGSSFANNKIMLGITSPDVVMEESDGGNVLAFVNENRIYSYNVIDNDFVCMFGFYEDGSMDRRTLYKGSDIKILSVDEGGNVLFMVYGYMNRGRHEGETGVAVYYYNSSLDAVEEQAFIPDRRAPDRIAADVKRLSYVDKTGKLYIMLKGTVYEININSKISSVIIEGLSDDAYRISESGRSISYVSDKGREGLELTYKDLGTQRSVTITEGAGERLIPLGFMGEDLIYGIVRVSDIQVSDAGDVLKPMYRVCIRNGNNELQKTYEKPGVFITGAQLDANRINLQRISKGSYERYYTIEDDQIMNNESPAKMDNRIETAVTEGYETIVQIGVKSNINKRTLDILTPKEVLYEGGREISLRPSEIDIKRYYVYGIYGMEGVYTDEARAVSAAESLSGVVIGDDGGYIWKAVTRSPRNQIMAITAQKSDEERSSLSVCLDTMLSYEGEPRNTRFLLNSGQSAVDILEDNLPSREILVLSGCSLNSILYYVDMDIPVLASLGDGRDVLIVGFNEFNTVFFDPERGEIYKVGINDSRELFEENGNRFLTYARLWE